MKTTWKAVLGYEGVYEVSNQGEVRCLISRNGPRHGKIPFIIQPGIVNRRRQIWLSNGIKRRGFQVHRLVMLAFIGPCPPMKEVNHKDGDPANNSLENLEYITRSQNQLHAYRVLGLKRNQGSQHGRSKLNEKDVLKIREMLSWGADQSQVAKLFHVHLQTIAKISCRMTWRHI